MVGETSHSGAPRRRTVAAAATVHVQGRPDSDGRARSRNMCMSEGCDQNHLLYRCPKFLDVSVVEWKSFVQIHRLCFLCLRGGHWSDGCPKLDVVGLCRVNGCDVCHSDLLHESIAGGFVIASTAYETSCIETPNCMMMLQLTPVLNSRCQQSSCLIVAPTWH